MNLNQWCSKNHVSLLWAQIHSGTLSVFCYPDLALIESFQGENPRPENDMLLTQHINLTGETLHVVCTKKHFLSSDYEVKLSLNGLLAAQGKIQVINNKEFSMEKSNAEFNCDETYLVKVMKRGDDDDKYLPFNESLKHQQSLQNGTEELKMDFSGILGSILGCEIYSSMIQKTRLPLHQWLHVDLSCKEKLSEKSGELNRILILGKNTFSDCLKNVLKKSCQNIEVMNSDEFERLDVPAADNEKILVICCGGTYEERR